MQAPGFRAPMATAKPDHLRPVGKSYVLRLAWKRQAPIVTVFTIASEILPRKL